MRDAKATIHRIETRTSNPRSKAFWRGVLALITLTLFVVSIVAAGGGVLLVGMGRTSAQLAFVNSAILFAVAFIIAAILCAEWVIEGRLILKEGIVLRIERAQRRVLVDPFAWHAASPQKKEDIAMRISAHSRSSLGKFDICDAQSGKRLASYGPREGFEVY